MANSKSKIKNTTKGTEFEKVIQKIYLLIGMKDRISAKVDRDVTLIGSDGSTNQFDVIYEYEHLGSIFRVAIECKDWNKPVNVASLRDFYYKLRNVGGLNSIFISKDSYFQDGAKKVAIFNGIKIMQFKEFNKFISFDNEYCLTPSQDTVGDPFWTLMMIGGKNLFEQLQVNGTILLFDSKFFADYFFKKQLLSSSEYKVVGLSQSHLKSIKKIYHNHKGINIKIFNPVKSSLSILDFHFNENIDSNDLDWFIRE